MKQKLIRIFAAGCVLLVAFGALAEPEITPQAEIEEQEVDMLAVDHKLYELGYRDSACRGVLDEIVINALKNFQTVNGLEPTGEPDDATVILLLEGKAISKDAYLNAMAQRTASYSPLADGSTGDSVTRLQNRLKDMGYFSGSSDGVYGAATEAAVYRFQLANGLNETGIADSAVFLRLYEGTPLSWESFLAAGCASVGDSGHHVRRLQLWLKKKGYFSGECTGRYGDGTRQAVLRFQEDNDLEESGDVDLPTSRKLYDNVATFLHDSAKLRRGDAGTAAEQLCRDLAALGYPAHARFNMQTELALMQFQLVNKLDVSGVADEITLARLRSENVVARENYQPSKHLLPETEDLGHKLARQAASMLGQFSEMDSYMDFVQYVALRCDVELMDESQLNRLDIGKADTIEAGAIIGVQMGDEEIRGIATSDRAIIYRAGSGYIVMNYLDRMEFDGLSLYHLIEEA